MVDGDAPARAATRGVHGRSAGEPARRQADVGRTWLSRNRPNRHCAEKRDELRGDDIATSTGLYSGCAHATDGKPARHAQSSYATHPWVATPIAPISADTTIIATPTCCQRVSVSPKYLTSIGLPSQ